MKQSFGKERKENIQEVKPKIINPELATQEQELKENQQQEPSEKRREELARTLNIPKEQISLTGEGALSGNILYHDGDLKLNDLTIAEGLNLPKTIGGSLSLPNLNIAKNLNFPNQIDGDLNHNLPNTPVSYTHLTLPTILLV